MKKIKHPTEILTEAGAIVISSSVIFAEALLFFALSIFIFVLFLL